MLSCLAYVLRGTGPHVPGTTDSFDRVPGTTDSFDRVPGTTDSFDRVPETTDSFDRVPGTSYSFDRLPEVELLNYSTYTSSNSKLAFIPRYVLHATGPCVPGG